MRASDGFQPRTAAILLAAGESSRMGSPKPLLPWCGTTLVAFQVQQLAVAGIDPVIVVVGHEARLVADAASSNARAVVRVNAAYREGKAGSIRVGAEAVPASCGAVLLLGVDQPRSAEVIRRLVVHHYLGKKTITVPVFRGRRGHPPIFASSLLPELLLLREETMGLRQVMNDHRSEVLEVPVENEEVLADLNTPEDYRRAQSFFADSVMRVPD